MITANLPSGYHRDFQLLKEVLFPALETLKQCLLIAGEAVKELEVREDILDDDRYRLIYSVEAVNQLVLEGMPFRDAYKEVGRQIKEGTFEVPEELNHTHEGSIGNLMTEEIRDMFMNIYKRLKTED